MTDFSPHAVLRHPSIPDEEVWDLINRCSSKYGGPVVLIIEPACELERGARSLPASWPVLEKLLEKLEKPTGRGPRKPKARK